MRRLVRSALPSAMESMDEFLGKLTAAFGKLWGDGSQLGAASSTFEVPEDYKQTKIGG